MFPFPLLVANCWSFYLKKDYSDDVKAASLIELLWDADSTEEACVEEFLSVAVKEKIIDSSIYKTLWRKY